MGKAIDFGTKFNYAKYNAFVFSGVKQLIYVVSFHKICINRVQHGKWKYFSKRKTKKVKLKIHNTENLPMTHTLDSFLVSGFLSFLTVFSPSKFHE